MTSRRVIAATRVALSASLLAAAACRQTAPREPAAADAARAPVVAQAPPDARAAEPAAPAPPPPAAAPAEPARPRGKVIALVHSSNLRGEYEAHPVGGLHRRARLLADVRREADAVLHVDAGDTVLPALVEPPKGQLLPDPAELDRRAALVANGLGRMGLDAFTPGETDLALGPSKLAALVRKAKLPAVAANLMGPTGKPLFPASRVVEAGGLQIGIFGLVTLPPGPRPNAGVSASDPVAAGRTAVTSLRDREVNLVVGLFHLAGGLAEARKLVAEIDGVDVVVLGHDAETLEAPVNVGGTRIVEAFRDGKYVGRLDLHVVGGSLSFPDPPTPGSSWMGSRILRLDPAVGSDPAMHALVKDYVVTSRQRAERGLAVGADARPPAKKAEQPFETWDYASNGACELCHLEETRQWQSTPHALALGTLQGKGRGRDLACLPCHTTGFLQPGGTRYVDTAKYFGGVGCESCHGPSAAHVRSQNKKGTLRKVPEALCRECHRPESSPEPFDFAAANKLVIGPGHGVVDPATDHGPQPRP